MSRVSPRVLGLLATLTLIWGTNWPLFRIALDELPVLTFRSVVLVTGLVVLYAVIRLRGESLAVPPGRWLPLTVASATNIAIWNIATSLAVLYVPSGHASVLAYTMPLWVALIGFVVFGQSLTGRLLLALLIGAGAVVALMAPNFVSYANAPWGLFWGLLAGLSWAIGTYVVKRTAWPGMGLSLTFWQVVIALPPIALGALVIDGLPQHWPSTTVIVTTLYIGAIPMAIGTATWFALVKLLPAQVAALSSITIPIVAVVSGIFLLHEPLSPLQAIAIASTVISLWLALVPR
ncbi:EamA domain-containing membrane protein RarD [Enhydrobacter aerosaccus]|uniref:EamA domain-containing membrane protein RarD n=1 Tax=Enhydrobacter aerosaccus TaxID=225324 RepID=A0A1T4PFN9_9HYPH|nr:DMT family transporter [Enhydrobacter aerosaccus]SJZ90374.1 EamA domain-containing membrane protein RarD [Enhydrobacter aerosaccus]